MDCIRLWELQTVKELSLADLQQSEAQLPDAFFYSRRRPWVGVATKMEGDDVLSKMRIKVMMAVVGMMMTCLVGMASASVVIKTTDLADGNWRYEYIVTNAYTQNLVYLDTSFPAGTDFFLYEVSPKAGWSIESIAGLYIAGADAGGGIAPGATEGGFMVSFSYSGSPGGVPAPQIYNVNYADGHQESGLAAPVPEPGTGLLLALFLPLAAGYRQFRKRNPAL